MNNEWSTPQALFDELNDEFHFDLDVCARKWNAKCELYLDPTIDGLTAVWHSRCSWMNPPFGREIQHWVKKAYEEAQLGKTVVCLLPARTDTGWWHDYALKGEIRYLRGRVHFTDETGKTGRPRFGNAIVIFRPKAGGE